MTQIVAPGTFRLTRPFSQSPDRLWHWLTDPDARSAWGAPSDTDVLILEKTDLREDGAERHRCGPAEAPDYAVATRWYRLDAPKLACFTETVEAQGSRVATSLVSYTLAATDAGCTLTVDVSVHSLIDEDISDDFQSGWTSALDRLPGIIAAADAKATS